MIFFVRYADKEFRVRVENRDHKLYIKFENEPEEEANLIFYGHSCTFYRNNKVFFANVEGEKNNYTVWRPDGNLYLTVESEYRRIVSLLRGQALEDENNVYAKMPGKIVKILVKEGDKVKAGDSLLVIEAMKMENEIKATFSGEIARIQVAEGQVVETGELLIELV